MLQLERGVIAFGFPLEFHTAQSHPYPLVEITECTFAVGPVPGKVVCHAANDAVQSDDHVGIQIVATSGDLSDFVFEVLHGLRTHLDESRFDSES